MLLFSYFSMAQSSFINAIDFDGNGDYASTINEPAFPTWNGTIEVWIKVDTILGVTGLGDAFISKNKESWFDGDFYMWFESVSGKLIASIQSTPNNPPVHTNVQSNVSFWNNYNNWCHVAFSWGNSGMKLYIDGVLQSSQSSVSHPAMTGINNFYLGAQGYKLSSGNYNVTDFFHGQIDEVRVWDHQRSIEQITSLSGAPLDSIYYSSTDSGLVGYWKFDELEDLGINNDGIDDARDYSVFQNHLDLSGDAHLVSNSQTSIITVINPSGGEVLTVGSTYFIKWTSENVADVKIEYSTNNGNNWISVTDSIPSTGIYQWTVPSTLTTEGRVH